MRCSECVKSLFEPLIFKKGCQNNGLIETVSYASGTVSIVYGIAMACLGKSLIGATLNVVYGASAIAFGASGLPIFLLLPLISMVGVAVAPFLL